MTHLKKKGVISLFTKQLLKKLGVCLILMTVCLNLTACSRTKKESKEVRSWWGSKEQICEFLNTPEAKAERWLVEALGE